MFAALMRFGAIIALPFALASAATAQQDVPQEEAALILFSGKDFRGAATNVFDPILSLHDLDFNDRARSVSVLSGAWELCENVDFTGRCVFLREDSPDLSYFGLEGIVSSVRPIYEYTDAASGLMFTRDENGYIHYADETDYGYNDYAYDDRYDDGYGATTRVEIYHYGYSPAYRSYGYYDPLAGYGPYGFGYSRGGYNSYRPAYYNHKRRPVRGHHGAKNGAATLYTDSNGRGASLGINHGISDLSRYRFNDNVSSLDIRSGKWEVCEHANYQGRCQVIDASTGKLNGYRLNDNISSIRPVPGTLPDTGRGDRKGDRDGQKGRRDGDARGDRGRGDRDQGRRGAVAAAPTTQQPRAGNLAGGPGTIPSLPDTTLPNRPTRGQRGVVAPDPVATTPQARPDRDRRDYSRSNATRTTRPDSSTKRSDTSRTRVERPRVVRPASSTPAAQPQRQKAQRARPQTPAVQARQPVRAPVQRAAPQRAPTRAVTQRAPVKAAPPPRQVRSAPTPRPAQAAPTPRPAPQRQVQRPNPRSSDGMRGRQNGRVGKNQK
jgi:hypothetical protein